MKHEAFQHYKAPEGKTLQKVEDHSGDICCGKMALSEAETLFILLGKYKEEIGEDGSLSPAQKDRLISAIGCGDIQFFLIKCEGHAIGMCSLSRLFSTYACAPMGIVEDVFIEPSFRKKGHIRRLMRWVQAYCTSEGIRSLWVGSSQSDQGMYASLGFDMPLGQLMAWSAEETP